MSLLVCLSLGSVVAGQGHQGRMNSSPYPHRSNSLPHLKEYNRTPIPSRAWITGHDHASSSNYYTDKGVPLYVIHNVPGDLPRAVPPNSTNVQQVSQSAAAGGSKFGTIIHPQYQSGFYSPGKVRAQEGNGQILLWCSVTSSKPNMFHVICLSGLLQWLSVVPLAPWT